MKLKMNSIRIVDLPRLSKKKKKWDKIDGVVQKYLKEFQSEILSSGISILNNTHQVSKKTKSGIPLLSSHLKILLKPRRLRELFSNKSRIMISLFVPKTPTEQVKLR